MYAATDAFFERAVEPFNGPHVFILGCDVESVLGHNGLDGFEFLVGADKINFETTPVVFLDDREEHALEVAGLAILEAGSGCVVDTPGNGGQKYLAIDMDVVDLEDHLAVRAQYVVRDVGDDTVDAFRLA